jgi:hypothetical protein
MPLSPAQSALVIGLRTLGLFGLAGYLYSHSLLVDFLSIHPVDSFV